MIITCIRSNRSSSSSSKFEGTWPWRGVVRNMISAHTVGRVVRNGRGRMWAGRRHR
jgi:hypothetical protein